MNTRSILLFRCLFQTGKKAIRLTGRMLITSSISTVSEKKWANAGSSKTTSGIARQWARQSEERNMLNLVKMGILLTDIPCFKIKITP